MCASEDGVRKREWSCLNDDAVPGHLVCRYFDFVCIISNLRLLSLMTDPVSFILWPLLEMKMCQKLQFHTYLNDRKWLARSMNVSCLWPVQDKFKDSHFFCAIHKWIRQKRLHPKAYINRWNDQIISKRFAPCKTDWLMSYCLRRYSVVKSINRQIVFFSIHHFCDKSFSKNH